MRGYSSSPTPRPPLFLCTEMNFRQIPFSETQLPLPDVRGIPPPCRRNPFTQLDVQGFLAVGSS